MQLLTYRPAPESGIAQIDYDLDGKHLYVHLDDGALLKSTGSVIPYPRFKRLLQRVWRDAKPAELLLDLELFFGVQTCRGADEQSLAESPWTIVLPATMPQTKASAKTRIRLEQRAAEIQRRLVLSRWSTEALYG